MRLLNRRSQNPFPDLVRLFFAPRGMIRRVQPHLENIRHSNPLMSDHRPEHRLFVFRDSNVCVPVSFRIFDRKAEPLQGGPGPYLETQDRFQQTLDVKTIVPGHGPFGSACSFSHLKSYLWELAVDVHRALTVGLSERATVSALQLDSKYHITFWNPMSRLNPLLENLHRLNVLATYRALNREPHN
jgi:hypothetical protein